MAREIERKFLVKMQFMPPLMEGMCIEQGYLLSHGCRELRVRIVDRQAFLTYKEKVKPGVRKEFEFEIPYEEGVALIDDCMYKVFKVRHMLHYGGHRWEIDRYLNSDRIVAEIELQSENQRFPAPPWLGAEVTEDPKYTNEYIARHPFD